MAEKGLFGVDSVKRYIAKLKNVGNPMSDLSDSKVLLVDDTAANIDILLDMLGTDYDVSIALNGEEALESVQRFSPDLVLLDIMMPGMDGYEVGAILKEGETTKDIPIIFVTALSEERDEAKGLRLGAVDYITKPFRPELVKARVRNHLELNKYRNSLKEQVEERTRELALTQTVTIHAMAVLAEIRDNETGEHIQRTQGYISILARQLNETPKYRNSFRESDIDLLYKSAPLHDIGKVGVPDSILRKPGKLTAEEFNEMKKHTFYGWKAISTAEKILGSNSFLRYAKNIAYSHHEKWDGTGYPLQLKGESIPLSGRLMAVADVYDALVSKRIYKPSLPHSKAITIIEEERGKHFDPDIIDAFLAQSDEFARISQQISQECVH